MRSQDIEFEHCCECDGYTGRAGRSDDSLYAGDYGPYCEDCWGDVPEKLVDRINQLEVMVADLAIQNTVVVEHSAVLWEAAQAMHDDLLMRAETDSKGTKVVNVSYSVWKRFKTALEWEW